MMESAMGGACGHIKACVDYTCFHIKENSLLKHEFPTHISRGKPYRIKQNFYVRDNLSNRTSQ